jgi:MarR family transcriptional regulator, organic hydroperoxide resistance regulator
VLLLLCRNDAMSGAQLARASGVTQQSMASVLTGMQGKGLIATGRDLLDQAYREVNVLERALTDRFTAEEHERFCEFLDRTTATLVEQTPTAHAD